MTMQGSARLPELAAPHDYVFQIFALRQSPALAEAPGRGALIDAMRGHVLAKGTLTGVYYRS